jgi:hypothetical protein
MRRIRAGIWIASAPAKDDAPMRVSFVFALALAAAPAAARADVTVIYAAPAPTAPLVAVPVPCGQAHSAPPARSRSASLGSGPVAAPTAHRAAETVAPAVPRSETAPLGSMTAASTSDLSTSDAVASTGSPPPPRTPRESGCQPPSPVRFVRTTDGSRETRLVRLTDCHGAPEAEAILELSILARPRTAERPSERDLAAHENDPELFASEVRRLDPGLLTRLQAIAERFPGRDIEITSGYRPDASETSRHRTGHALDVRVVDAPLEEVHALALGFDESGIGLYPTSEFLHVDVRPRVTRWVDLAGPGEPANMVEVVTGRDGHAASAPALQWPAAPEPTAPPHRHRARGSRDEEDQRAALREALEALEALDGLDLQVP